MGEIIFPVQSAKISGTGAIASSFASIDGGALGWKLLFDASQTESALFQVKLPDDYSSSPVFKGLYSMVSGTSASINLECDVMAVTPGDSASIDSVSFATGNEVSATVPTTAGYVGSAYITLTNNDSMAAGDIVIFRINRDHDDAGDTATGDLALLTASLMYTSA